MADSSSNRRNKLCACGAEGVAWVLVLVSYPMSTQPGRTVGRHFCTQHLAELKEQLDREKFA